MALNVAAFTADLISLSNELLTAAEAGSPKSSGYWEEQIAILITEYIRSAEVQPGIALTTPDTINGATTGLGILL